MSEFKEFDDVFGVDNKEVEDFMALGQVIIDKNENSTHTSINDVVAESLSMTPEERRMRIKENLAGFAEIREVFKMENIIEGLTSNGREPDPRIVGLITSLGADMDALEEMHKVIEDYPDLTDAELVEKTGWGANDILSMVNGIMKKILIIDAYTKSLYGENKNEE